MNALRYQRVKEIFAEASHLAGIERNRFLDEMCGGDAELRTEVESLLSHDDHSDGFMEAPAIAGSLESILSTQALSDSTTSEPPKRIGQYEIIGELGRGGMGVVYRARQGKPSREVALKVIRPGVASPDMLRRFEYETQLLGRLRHPAIAQIYEAGTADTGAGAQPFYAMELVEGQSLNEFLKLHPLTVSQKLELIIGICDAVHHAHQKGIIHRDLKPGNVLIERSGSGSWQPKILDFGVARAIGANDRRTLVTNAGQLIGTIAYMSPEQVTGDSDDLDIRSDVYALGVMAFEMLAGRRPHSFGEKSLAECARIIRDDAPLRLSKVDRALGGDLETIIAKALEKDRDRRYQSAAEFAADLRRYLNHQPISARRPTAIYRARKFVRRRPLVSGSLAALFIVIATASVLVLSAQSAARTAQQLRAMAEEMKLDLASFVKQAEANADPLRPIHVDPAKLERISLFVSEKLVNEPQLAIQLRNLLGENYVLLGQFEAAAWQVQTALALLDWPNAQRPSEDLGDSLQNIGRVLFHEGRYSDAIPMYQRALDVRKQELGANHRDTAMTISHMAACLRKMGDYQQAESLYREALGIRTDLPGDNQALVASSYNSLALFLMDQGRWAEAAEGFHRSLELVAGAARVDDLRVARTQTHLAGCLIQLGQLQDAEVLLEAALQSQGRELPAHHPDAANTLRTQAELRLAERDLGESERLARSALQIQLELLGPNHADVADTYLVLGEVLEQADSLEQAIDALEDSLRIRTASVPETHWLIRHTSDLLEQCRTRRIDQQLRNPDPEISGL